MAMVRLHKRLMCKAPMGQEVNPLLPRPRRPTRDHADADCGAEGIRQWERMGMRTTNMAHVLEPRLRPSRHRQVLLWI
jgi:hypothetical protein